MIEDFYAAQEKAARQRCDELEHQLDKLERHRHSRLAQLAERAPAPLDWLLRPAALTIAHGAVDVQFDPEQHDMHEAAPDALEHTPQTVFGSRRALKSGIFELVRTLNHLKEYRSLNVQGLTRLVRIFDDVSGKAIADAYVEDVIRVASFVTSPTVDRLLTRVTRLYADHYVHGDHHEARSQLRRIDEETDSFPSVARGGFWLGLSVVPLALALYQSFDPEIRRRVPNWSTILQLFSVGLIPIVFSLLFSLAVSSWHRYDINWILVAELTLGHREYLDLPSSLLALLSVLAWAALNDPFPELIAPTSYPALWLGMAAAVMLNPFPVLYRQTRFWLIRKIGRGLTCGLASGINFSEFLVVDIAASLITAVMCSFGYSLERIAYYACVYSRDFAGAPPACAPSQTWVSPALKAVPKLARLGQSLRRYHDKNGLPSLQLVDAVKFALGIVQCFAYAAWRISGETKPWQITFILISVADSLANAVWDVMADWNLGWPKHGFLRAETMLPTWFYWWSIGSNTVTRFAWIVFFTPLDAELAPFVEALIEVARRAQWVGLRVESEHFGMADAFRDTRDVPLPFTARKESQFTDSDDDSDEDDERKA